jgi:hypothetical protein
MALWCALLFEAKTLLGLIEWIIHHDSQQRAKEPISCIEIEEAGGCGCLPANP